MGARHGQACHVPGRGWHRGRSRTLVPRGTPSGCAQASWYAGTEYSAGRW